MNYTDCDDSTHLALSTYVKLMRAASAVTARTLRHLSGEHLSESQFAVLEALYHLGPLCQRDLARKILKSTGNITMVIDNLERRLLVSRQKNASDRRFRSIALTCTGRQLMDKVFPRHSAGIVTDLSVLSQEEQLELGRLCRKLGRHENAQGNQADGHAASATL